VKPAESAVQQAHLDSVAVVVAFVLEDHAAARLVIGDCDARELAWRLASLFAAELTDQYENRDDLLYALRMVTQRVTEEELRP
jgi:hypothetical protein